MTKKTDSVRFNSYESLVAPFAYEDVEFVVTKLSDVIPVFYKEKTTFGRKLSDKIGLFSAKGYGSISALKKLLESPDITAIIIDFSSGFNLGLEFTRMVIREIENETKKERPKCVCLLLQPNAEIKAKSSLQILQQLKSKGIHAVNGITLTALIQKMSMIFGSVEEFNTPKSQSDAIEKNLCRENKNDNLHINTPAEMRMVQLSRHLSEVLGKSTEKQRNDIVFRFEMTLVEKEMRQIIRKITQFGLTLTTIAEQGQICALHWAIKHKSLDFIQFLYNCCCDFNFQDKQFGNALMIALLNDRIEIANWMCDKGFFANASLTTISKYIGE